MLIHIAPRLYLAGYAVNCDLVDMKIEEFGLHLRGGKDLVVRRPYPNKYYLVGCRKTGKKAIDGILVATPQRPESFVSVTRWAVNAEQIITHRVRYVVIDSDFDAASDDMMLWHSTPDSLGGWGSRWPEVHPEATPANSRPRMDIVPAEAPGAMRVGDVRDVVTPDGIIVERVETFRLPTLEKERLFSNQINDRVPDLSMAFQVPAATIGQEQGQPA